MIRKENSSEIAMGQCPKPKSEEFSLWIILVIEIFTILCLKPLKKCYCSQLKSAQVVRISAVPAGGLTCRLAPGSRTTRSGRRATVFVWSQNSDALGRSDHPEFDGWSRNRY